MLTSPLPSFLHTCLLVFLVGCSDAKQSLGLHQAAQLLAENRCLEPRLSVDGSATRCVIGSGVQEIYCDEWVTSANAQRARRRLASFLPYLSAQQKALVQLARGSRTALPAQLLERSFTTKTTSEGWSDLSASLLVAAAGAADWSTLSSAIAAADTAIELDPENQRALFNRALALERLGLTEQAADMWRIAKPLTRSRTWRAEIEERLGALIHGYCETCSQRPRAWQRAINEASVVWLVANPSAVRIALMDSGTVLHRAVEDLNGFCEDEGPYWRSIADAFESRFGEHLVSDWIKFACDVPGRSVLKRERALKLLQNAQKEYNAASLDRAIAEATAAQEALLGTAGLHDLAALLRAASLAWGSEPELARDALMPKLDGWTNRYPLLAARAHDVLGALDARRAELERATEHYQAGIALVANGLDPTRVTRLRALKAEALARAGQYNEAWSEGLTALRDAREQKLGQSMIAASCDFLSLVAAESSDPRLQELYADCAVRNGTSKDTANNLASSYLTRAHARFSLGKQAQALADLHLATEAIEAIEDVEQRTDIFNYTRLHRAVAGVTSADATELSRLKDCPSNLLPVASSQSSGAQHAVCELHALRKYFFARGHVENALHAGKALADAYQRGGHDEAAAAEFDRISDTLYAVRGTATAHFQMSLYEHYRVVFQREVQRRLGATKEGRKALVALQQAREGAASGLQSVNTFLDASSEIPEGEATLVIAWLERAVAVWLIDRSGLVTWAVSPLIDGATIVGRAADTHSLPVVGGRIGALETLYEAIVGPWEPRLNSYKRLRIVPDGPSFGLPFAALRNPRTGRYLVEETAIVISPRLSSHRPRTPVLDTVESAAIFDGSMLGTERALTAAATETNLIYKRLNTPGRRVVLYRDRQSNAMQFLRAIGSVDLIHFAGHGTINANAPLESQLVFGERPGDGNVLTAARLYAADGLQIAGQPASLIVLASCDSASYSDRLPHALALVRPLLALGVPQVIGSLQPIEDKAYLHLMDAFYEELASSRSAANALWEVQRSAAASTPMDSPPGSWAYLQLFE